MKNEKKVKYTLITKESIKKLLSLWNDHTTDELAQELGWPHWKISNLAKKMRSVGFDLPRKHVLKMTDTLIKEVYNELYEKRNSRSK